MQAAVRASGSSVRVLVASIKSADSIAALAARVSGRPTGLASSSVLCATCSKSACQSVLMLLWPVPCLIR
jgi:hypothetical protein